MLEQSRVFCGYIHNLRVGKEVFKIALRFDTHAIYIHNSTAPTRAAVCFIKMSKYNSSFAHSLARNTTCRYKCI